MVHNTPVLCNGSSSAKTTLILAHGAGAPMDSPFMEAFAEGMAARGLFVVRFEFPYMAERRETGKKKPPNRAPILLETWGQIINEYPSDRLIIGGKSMGGRMASLWVAENEADNIAVSAVVCLGYPFHPPGKPEKLRTEHLLDIKTPVLMCQGERDTFGRRDEVAAYNLPQTISWHWLPDGDHGFKPRKASGFTEPGNWESAMDAIGAFSASLK